MMDAQWVCSVENYLHRLEAAVDALAGALKGFEAHTAAGGFDSLGEPMEATAAAAADLEALLDERARLLADTEIDGQRGRSLRSVLEQGGESELLARCERVAERIDQQRLYTVSSFVTQFHLAETGRHLVRILTRSQTDPGTYGPQGRNVGGGLLDEAA